MKNFFTLILTATLFSLSASSAEPQGNRGAFDYARDTTLKPYMGSVELADTFAGNLWAIHIRAPKGPIPERISEFFVLELHKPNPRETSGSVKIAYLFKRPFSTEDAKWTIKSDPLCFFAQDGIVISTKAGTFCLTFRGPSEIWDAHHLGGMFGLTEKREQFGASIEAIRLDFDLGEAMRARGTMSAGPANVTLPGDRRWEFRGITTNWLLRLIITGWTSGDQFGIAIRRGKTGQPQGQFDSLSKELLSDARKILPEEDMENVTVTDVAVPLASCVRKIGVHARTDFQAVQVCAAIYKSEIYVIELDVVERKGVNFKAFSDDARRILDSFSVAQGH